MVAATREHIDLANETMLDFEDVRKMFATPAKPNGITRKTFESWRRMGLEVWSFGGLVRTTREALERFSVRIVCDEEPIVPTRRRNKEGEEAKARAAALL